MPAYHRKRKYALTEDAYQDLVRLHAGKCALCGEEQKLVVDHDHATGSVRALLCHRCNRGLGHFQDNVDLLDAAKTYLLRHRKLTLE